MPSDRGVRRQIGVGFPTPILLVLALAGCGGGRSAPPSGASPAAGPLFLITKVTDGDTVHVIYDGHDERVRLIGINTPESVDPRRPVAERVAKHPVRFAAGDRTAVMQAPVRRVARPVRVWLALA